MGFFRTKDPKTGEPRAGAGVYIIVCALMIGGAVFWNLRKNADVGNFNERVPVTNTIQNPSDISPVAEAAKQHSDVAPLGDTQPQADGAGLRGSLLEAGNKTVAASIDPTKTEETVEDLSTIQDTMNLLRTNQDTVEKEKAAAAAKAKEDAEAKAKAEIESLRKKLTAQKQPTRTSPTTPTAEPTKETPVAPVRSQFGSFSEETPESSQNVDTVSVVYDITTDRTQAQVATVAATTSGFANGHFLPRGFSFPVYILSTVQSTGQEDIVEMAVAQNVVFQHKVQIPFGTHLLGSAAADSKEDRIMINVDTILYPDGRELPISAFLKDAFDLSSGVRGYYIPQPARVQLLPYINEFIATWTEAAADRFANSGNNNDSNSNGESRQSALDNSASLIRDQAKKIQERLENRYPDKVVIPIGTRAYVKLRSPLDLERAAVAGSLGNDQPILPGFENNPVRANGTVEKTANYGITSEPVTNTTQEQQAQTSKAQEQSTAAEEMQDRLDKQRQESLAAQQQQQAAIQKITQQQTQQYDEGIKKLQALTEALKSRNNPTSSSNTSSAASKTDWPSGDIE